MYEGVASFGLVLEHEERISTFVIVSFLYVLYKARAGGSAWEYA